MISCMIAAAQTNFSALGEVYPPRIVGTRVVGDRFCFYSANIGNAYLGDLRDGLPKRDLIVNKYPSGEGLSASITRERRTLLECLSSLKDYALSLTPRYDQ